MILVLGSVPVFTNAVVAKLTADGVSTLVVSDAGGSGPECRQALQTDLARPDSIAAIRRSLGGKSPGGIVNLLPLAPAYRDGGDGCPSRLATSVFQVVQAFEHDLRMSAGRGAGKIWNVTSIDGGFGFDQHSSVGPHHPNASQAGTVGFFKAIKREWPELTVKNIDIDPNDDPELLLIALSEEFDADDDALEVCLTSRGRRIVRTVSQPLPATQTEERLPLDRDSVILVTGGGRGLTASAACRLARSYPCRFVLLGRTDLEAAECHQTACFSDESSLRQHFIAESSRNAVATTPGHINQTIHRLLEQRQLRQTIRDIESFGGRVEYHRLDVSDAAGFSRLIDDLYDRHARIDGVIHGAGILEDRLVGKKSLDSFRRVFATKVNPARILADRLRPEQLQFLVFFSSIAGRYGNRGQADYSAANECMNKMAATLSRKFRRVISFCWGPWDGGMVNDHYRKLFVEHGIELIGLEEGLEAFIAELHARRTHGPEVIWGRSLDRIEKGSLRMGAM